MPYADTVLLEASLEYGNGDGDSTSPQDTTTLTNMQSQSSIDEKALMRKIDLRVLPILFVVYLAAFLDRFVCINVACYLQTAYAPIRVNISNALVLKLPKDLGLVSDQANIALTIFFVPYIVFEVPSNIAMKRFKPHVWCR